MMGWVFGKDGKQQQVSSSGTRESDDEEDYEYDDAPSPPPEVVMIPQQMPVYVREKLIQPGPKPSNGAPPPSPSIGDRLSVEDAVDDTVHPSLLRRTGTQRAPTPREKSALLGVASQVSATRGEDRVRSLLRELLFDDREFFETMYTFARQVEGAAMVKPGAFWSSDKEGFDALVHEMFTVVKNAARSYRTRAPRTEPLQQEDRPFTLPALLESMSDAVFEVAPTDITSINHLTPLTEALTATASIALNRVMTDINTGSDHLRIVIEDPSNLIVKAVEQVVGVVRRVYIVGPLGDIDYSRRQMPSAVPKAPGTFYPKEEPPSAEEIAAAQAAADDDKGKGKASSSSASASSSSSSSSSPQPTLFKTPQTSRDTTALFILQALASQMSRMLVNGDNPGRADHPGYLHSVTKDPEHVPPSIMLDMIAAQQTTDRGRRMLWSLLGGGGADIDDRREALFQRLVSPQFMSELYESRNIVDPSRTLYSLVERRRTGFANLVAKKYILKRLSASSVAPVGRVKQARQDVGVAITFLKRDLSHSTSRMIPGGASMSISNLLNPMSPASSFRMSAPAPYAPTPSFGFLV